MTEEQNGFHDLAAEIAAERSMTFDEAADRIGRILDADMEAAARRVKAALGGDPFRFSEDGRRIHIEGDTNDV